jgi:hypothetical protein
VRRSGRITVKGNPEHVLRLVRVPPHRPFSSTAALHLQLKPRTAAKGRALYVEAVAAAAGAWPQLEEVALGEVQEVESDDEWDERGRCFRRARAACRRKPHEW